MIIITDIELDLTGPTDMDLTDPLTMSVALPDDDNVSGSVFTDVDKDVADLSTSIATGEVELEAIVVDTDETSDSEERRVAQFAADGCSCNLGVKGSPCHQLFSATQYREMRDECRELSREELDLVVMGELRALTLRDRITQRSSERRRTFSKFQFGGHRVCKKTFCFLHNISFGKFHAIKSSWLENGLRPRERKHVTPHNVTNLSDIQYVVRFILNYSEDNAILLPGRVPGYKRDDIQLLPTSVTKREVWNLYSTAASQQGSHAVSYCLFCRLWKQLTPQVVVSKPRSDLCWTCQKNSTLIMRSHNKPVEEKTVVYKINNDIVCTV